MKKEFPFKDATYDIIGCAIDVHKKLGFGFLEKIYENALMVLFRRRGIDAKQQEAIDVYFEGEVIGTYFADIVVNDSIILELKAVEHTNGAHKAQLLNYLKAARKKVGLLLNFGKQRLEYERFIL